MRASLYFRVLFCAGCFALAGCSSPAPHPPTTPGTNDIPNLVFVCPSIYRGGQPAGLPGWQYLQSIGISNVIKLDTAEEGDDTLGESLGMTVHRHPIDTLQQLVTGPDAGMIAQAAAEITPGTFIHCKHGQDRTGLLVGYYRVKEQHWSKAEAYAEMLAGGFHPALLGLQRFWESLPE